MFMTDKNDDVTANANSTASYSLGRIGVIITTLGFMVFAGAFGYGYFELSKVNVSLAQMVSDLRKQQETDQQELQMLKQTVANKMNAVPQEQQPDQPAMKENAAIEQAISLVKLARSQIDIAHDAAAGYVTLNHAWEVLQNIQNPAVDSVKQKLKESIDALNAAQQVNFAQVYGALSSISSQLDNLPLPPAPLHTNQNEAPRNFSGMPWWKIQWHKTMDTLRKIVIVKYTGASEAPLIMPEEKTFLYQNLHAQMQVVMLALVDHNQGIFTSGLVQMTNWIQKYFVQDAETTKTILAQLDSLKQVAIVPPVVDLAGAQQMLEQSLTQQSQQLPATQ
jgi:uroporphyrin-3 C-methyltransferase